MDVEALRTFLAIERCGSITRASATLYRSQPAVSRRLALLEAELGVPLFERLAGGLVLSEAGRVLLPFAERAVAILQDAADAVQALQASDSGSLTMALVGTLASTSLTLVLRRFAQRYPHVDLQLRTASSREVSDLVRRAEVTLGLRYSDDAAPELHCELLFAERMVVAAAADHRLAGTRCSSLNALAHERWLAFPDPPGRTEAAALYVGQALDAAGVAAGQILRIDSLTAQKRLIEAGAGIALLPDSSIQEELAAGSLVVLAVEDLDLTVPVTVVTRRNGYLGPAAQALLQELRLAAGGIVAAANLRANRSAGPAGESSRSL